MTNGEPPCPAPEQARPVGREPERAIQGSMLRRLRRFLLRRMLDQTGNPHLHESLRGAAREAESLAWLTPVPLLVLPTLLEEKALRARDYARRQAELLDTTRRWHKRVLNSARPSTE